MPQNYVPGLKINVAKPERESSSLSSNFHVVPVLKIRFMMSGRCLWLVLVTIAQLWVFFKNWINLSPLVQFRFAFFFSLLEFFLFLSLELLSSRLDSHSFCPMILDNLYDIRILSANGIPDERPPFGKPISSDMSPTLI